MNLIENKNDIIIGSNSNLSVENNVAIGLVAELANSLTPNTKRAYLADIKQFFNIKDINQLTIDQVRSVTVATANQYFLKLNEQGLSASTINRKLQALTKFYKICCRREVGIMDYNPFSSDEGTARLKTKRYSNTRSLVDDEVKKFMEVISEDKSILGLRNKIIMLMLATTGMRRAEIASLTVGQITKNMGVPVVEFMGKGFQERFVVIAEAIKTLIDQYIALRGLTYRDWSMPLFVSHSSNAKEVKAITTETIYQLVKKTAKKAGLDEESISPHCFRHTYITKSLELGCSIQDVQDRVGHADVGTTRRYDHTARIIKGNPANELASIYGI